MSHGHFKEVCKCGTVISQCRCMSQNKTIKQGTCHKCKTKPIKVVTRKA